MNDQLLDSVAFFQREAVKTHKKVIIGTDFGLVTGYPMVNKPDEIKEPLIERFADLRSKTSNSTDFVVLSDVSLLDSQKHLKFLVIRIQKISAISLED